MTNSLIDQITSIKHIEPVFRIGDVVSIVGEYAGDWARCDLLIVGIERPTLDGELVEYLTYSTWMPGEGHTDGWRERDFCLKHRRAA